MSKAGSKDKCYWVVLAIALLYWVLLAAGPTFIGSCWQQDPTLKENKFN